MIASWGSGLRGVSLVIEGFVWMLSHSPDPRDQAAGRGGKACHSSAQSLPPFLSAFPLSPPPGRESVKGVPFPDKSPRMLRCGCVPVFVR